MLGTTSLFATTTYGLRDIPVKQIGSQISSLFTTPDFPIEEDLNITVLFTFDSAGKIVVLKVDSLNEDVINYVSESMNQKKIATPGERNRIFTLPLKIAR